MQYLLPPVARYFKTNLHAHSTVSDGRLTPQEVKDAYKAQGYSILCLTDHNIPANHSDMNEPDFLMLTGVEVNTQTSDSPNRKRTYHLNLIAKRPDLLWQPWPSTSIREETQPYREKAEADSMSNAYDVDSVNAIIAAANEKGYLVFYNHPGWSLQDYNDYAPLKGLWGMELCNYSSQTAGYDDRDNAIVYRDLCNLGNRIVPLGTDDNHSTRDLCGAWAMIGAEKLEYGSVIEAMERGDLYASTGPEIHSLTLDGATLSLRCSDARYISLESSNRFALIANPIHNDGLLREATFDISRWLTLTENSPNDWFRVVVHGPYGHYASTRAYFRDEVK
jgi:hypothetical protein